MPERFAEALSLREIQTTNRLESKAKGLSQSISWGNGLPVAEFSPDVLFCRESLDSGKQTRFVPP